MAFTKPRARAPLLRSFLAAGTVLAALARPLAWLLVLGWMVLIWSLSAQSFGTPGAKSLLWSWLANLAHAPLFGLLALWLVAASTRARARAALPEIGIGRALGVALAVVLWGVLDEWHQSHVAGRDSSALDVVTDFVGASSVLWIALYLGRGAASESGLKKRLLSAALLCAAAAALATLE